MNEAIKAPRLHLENNRLDVEPGYDAEVAKRLAPRGGSAQIWSEQSLFFGGVHGVERTGQAGELTGTGDQRRSGIALAV